MFIQLKSEGECRFDVNAEVFKQLVRITKDVHGEIETLEWINPPGNVQNRCSILEMILKTNPMFQDHYNPVFLNPRVAASLNKNG